MSRIALYIARSFCSLLLLFVRLFAFGIFLFYVFSSDRSFCSLLLLFVRLFLCSFVRSLAFGNLLFYFFLLIVRFFLMVNFLVFLPEHDYHGTVIIICLFVCFFYFYFISYYTCLQYLMNVNMCQYHSVSVCLFFWIVQYNQCNYQICFFRYSFNILIFQVKVIFEFVCFRSLFYSDLCYTTEWHILLFVMPKCYCYHDDVCDFCVCSFVCFCCLFYSDL